MYGIQYIELQKSCNDLMLSGEGGIRTPGTLRYDGFQDRCNRPLCHLSEVYLLVPPKFCAALSDKIVEMTCLCHIQFVVEVTFLEHFALKQTFVQEPVCVASVYAWAVIEILMVCEVHTMKFCIFVARVVIHLTG